MRDSVIDNLKVFAIFMVVLGHCIQFGSGSSYIVGGYYYDNIVFKFIYGFHMPLFMMISGFLFWKSSNKYSIRQLIINKFRAYLVPVVCWAIVSAFVSFIVRHDANHFIKALWGGVSGGLWFFRALFECILITICIKALFRDSYLAYLVVFLIMLFTPDQYFVFTKYMYPFFVIGYMCNKYNDFFVKILNCRAIVILTLVSYCVLMFFWNREDYIYTSHFSLLDKDMSEQLFIDLFRILVGILGSFSVWGLFRMMTMLSRPNALTQLVGIRSGGIYIVSVIILNRVLSVLTSGWHYSLIICILESLIVIFLSSLIVWALQQSKLLKFLLLP